jgi:hypothetical protein
MKRSLLTIIIFVLALTLTLSVALLSGEEMDKPFGGKADLEFAAATWKAIQGYSDWMIKTGYYPGTQPHGKVLRTFYSLVNINDKPYHVVIKDNYAGDDVSVDNVGQAPDKYLVAVTVMVQREEGYDPDNNNWFWAKYLPDGSLDTNAKGVKLAGRVAKGLNAGCISCHKAAKDNDYFFTNDK